MEDQVPLRKGGRPLKSSWGTFFASVNPGNRWPTREKRARGQPCLKPLGLFQAGPAGIGARKGRDGESPACV